MEPEHFWGCPSVRPVRHPCATEMDDARSHWTARARQTEARTAFELVRLGRDQCAVYVCVGWLCVCVCAEKSITNHVRRARLVPHGPR